MLQLVGLLYRHGATASTDAYFYLFGFGLLPVQILVVGVFYPLLLNEQRISRRGAMRFYRWTPFIAVLTVTAGGVVLAATGRMTTTVIVTAVLCAANAAVQGALWCRAVTVEASGEARFVASVALPANLAALTVLVFPWPTSAWTVNAMMLGLLAGNLALFAVFYRRRLGSDVVAGLPASPGRSQRRGFLWFFGKSAVGYGGSLTIQSISLTLPASALTLLAVPSKIVASVSTTFVNAVVPKYVHQQSASAAFANRLLARLLSVEAALTSAIVLGIAVAGVPYVALAAAVALWLLASTSAAVSQRVSFRFLHPRASRATMLVVPVVVVAAAVSTRSPNFNLTALVCAYALIDGGTSLLLLTALRLRRAALFSALTCGAILALWGYTLAR